MPAADRRLFKDMGIQALANYVSVAARIVRGFVVAGLLGPAQMGIVSTGNLILNYSAYADVGISQGLNREIPMDLGRGDLVRAHEWVWYGAYAKLIAGVLVLIGTIVWTLSPWGMHQPAVVKWVVLIAGATSITAGAVLVSQMVLKATADFAGAGKASVLLAILNLGAGILGALVWGPVGVATGVLLATAIAGVYGFARVRPVRPVMPSLERTMLLVRIGIPLALLTFMGFNLENIDQVIILAFLDRSALGLYSVVIQAGGLLTLTGLSLSNVVGPRLVRRYAEREEIDDIAGLTWKPAQALSGVLPPVICAAWVAGPLLITWLLPEYRASIAPFKIYMAAMFFLGLNLGVSSTLLALGKHRLNVPIMLGCIAVNVGIDYLLVRVLGLGLEGVALGSFVTYLLYWTAHTGLVRWYFVRSLPRALRLNLGLGWPGLLLGLFLVVSVKLGTLGIASPLVDGSFFALTLGLAFVRLWGMRTDIGELTRR